MYSSAGSKTDAALLCERLGIPMHTIAIEELYAGYERALAPVFAGAPPDTTEENLQARIRGMLMMAFSNKTGSILLATGNKSELATGYSTLYGDLCGGLAPIGDLLKTEVYALARAINRDREIIPEATLTKPPSAELRPNQTDQDSLPDYELLDRILELYVIDNLTRAEIVAHGFDDAIVADVLRRVGLAEYKRRQAPHHPQGLRARLRHRPPLPHRPRNPRSLLTTAWLLRVLQAIYDDEPAPDAHTVLELRFPGRSRRTVGTLR